MGVLKKITNEYFDEDSRAEDFVKFNTRDIEPVDMGGSVLWADRDLEVESGGDQYAFDRYFTCMEAEDFEMKIKDGWRFPTVEEFMELYEPKTGTDMEVVLEDDTLKKGTKCVIVFKNKDNGNVLRFDTVAYGANTGKVMSFYRLVSDKKEGREHNPIGVFNCYGYEEYLEELKKNKKDIYMVHEKNDTYTPARLVKDKK